MKADYLLIAHDVDSRYISHISHHVSLKEARQEAERKPYWENKKIYKLVEIVKEDKR